MAWCSARCCVICTVDGRPFGSSWYGKEVSTEDTRLTFMTLARIDFAEHPQSVIVLTNMFYAEALTLFPKVGSASRTRCAGSTCRSKGKTVPRVLPADPRTRRPSQPWAGRRRRAPRRGTPVYVTPSVMVLYRDDHEFALNDLNPATDGAPQPFEYDVVLAAQLYRSRNVGRDQGQERVGPTSPRRWPSPDGWSSFSRLDTILGWRVRRDLVAEDPFATPRHMPTGKASTPH